MFALVVRFTVRPGAGAAFDALVAETIREIRTHEPGTVIYLTHERAEHPDERVFYEAYRDRGAFDAHEQSPHTRRFLTERGQHLVGEPEVWWLTSTEDTSV